MVAPKESELVFRVARLINENKELSGNLKLLEKENRKLLEKIDYYNNLLAKLPQDIIEAHIQLETSKVLRFNMVTVLYLHIEGFKSISQERNSAEVIDELDKLFYHFGQIAEKYNIKQIKTIGDAFMCAGGVPEKNITNPIDVALAALEMREYIQELQQQYDLQNRKFWGLRLGIHTGPVTATLHGKKKINYDLKGDTVNIAIRIASASDDHEVNISVLTYELIKEYFKSDYNGKIPVKYKGDLETYYLKRLKPGFSADRKNGNHANEVFATKYLLTQFTDLQEIILDKLERELPPFLYYHNFKHTIDVVNQAELIGYGEGIDDEEILLLMTAALFHDAGHVIGYDNHEYFGTQIAREYLPKFKYTDKQIDVICDIIMATKLPPRPNTLLQKIICDSDLDYLGRSDFIPVSNTLYKELKEQNKVGTLNDWNKLQIVFLSNHQFFTKTANQLREVNKQKQIDRIKKLIEE